MYAMRVASPANSCWPARPSSARLNAYFSMRIACGDFEAMVRAHCRAVSSNWAWGTARFTTPHRSAVLAS